MDAVSVDASLNGSQRKTGHENDGGRARGRVEEELEGFLRVYKDGSAERFSHVVSNVAACEDPQQPVASKDVVLDSSRGLWARFYLPRKATPSQGRLPLVIYFHGGGFVLGSPAWSIYHVFMCRLASETKSMVISVGYRLAPEHRLPAAYDDCFGAVEWVRRQATIARSSQVQNQEPWLRSYVDFSQCFVAGDSAGGNIAHHVALRCAQTDLKPLEIRGAILLQPFFGGEIQSKWERETSDPMLSQRWIDVFWKLSLPAGANRDHFFCNPLNKVQQQIQNVPLPPILLCISEQDVLKERNLEYYQALRKIGKNVRHVIFNGVGHAFQVLNPDCRRISELTKVLHDFINNRNSSR